MKSKEFFRKLFSIYFIGNLAAMALVVVLIAFGLKFGLDIYTHHGEKITVPNLNHKLFSDANVVMEGLGLQLIVADTGYVKTLPPDCILSQTPEAGREVKEGRVVYVTINASHSPTLALPDIIDNSSYREAKAKLIAMGFQLGPPKFIAGEKDWVYAVTLDGQPLTTGQRVPQGAKLVIHVGDGLREESDSVVFIDMSDPFTDDEYTEPESVDDYTVEDAPTGAVDEFEVVTQPE